MTEPTPAAPPRRRSRVPLALVLVLCLAWLGLAAGAAAGALWLVPRDAGLAGGPMVIGYGLLGLLAGLVAAALVAWKAPRGLLFGTTAVAALLAVASLAFVGWRVLDLRAERRTAAGLDAPLPAAGDFRLEASIEESDGMRRFRSLTVDGDDWMVEWVAVGPEAAECEAQVVAGEAEALLAALHRIAQAGEELAPSCTPPPPEETYLWTFYEQDDGEATWRLVGDAGCLQRHPEVAELHRLLGGLVTAAVNDGRASCDL